MTKKISIKTDLHIGALNTPTQILDELRIKLYEDAGISMSDYARVGVDYPYGGGYMLSCVGWQFGAVNRGGGLVAVTDNSGPKYFDTDNPDVVKQMVSHAVLIWRGEAESHGF